MPKMIVLDANNTVLHISTILMVLQL